MPAVLAWLFVAVWWVPFCSSRYDGAPTEAVHSGLGAKQLAHCPSQTWPWGKARQTPNAPNVLRSEQQPMSAPATDSSADAEQMREPSAAREATCLALRGGAGAKRDKKEKTKSKRGGAAAHRPMDSDDIDGGIVP